MFETQQAASLRQNLWSHNHHYLLSSVFLCALCGKDFIRVYSRLTLVLLAASSQEPGASTQ
jgi:hypothetical protein